MLAQPAGWPLGPGPSHEVPSPRATSASGVHARRDNQPGAFRPRGFTPPRRLTPPETLRVCFTPQPPMGFCPSGVSPPKELSPPRRWQPMPSWRLFPLHPSFMRRRPRATLTCAASIRTGPFYRLQGFAPPGSPFVAANCLGLPRAGPLLGLHLLRVFPPSADRTDFAAPPLTRFSKPGFQGCPWLPNPPASQSVIPQTEWHCLSRGRRALARFLRLRTRRHFGKCPVRAFC